MDHYDICIVGAGMFGSTAAKYCQIINKNTKSILIGPDEPKPEDYSQREIFSAHYDEGRIASHLDNDPIWCHLAGESIKRFRSIESESNINFFVENGYLDLFKKGDPNFEKCRTIAQSHQVDFVELTSAESIRSRFPFMNPSADTVGLLEPSKSGALNPRKLTSAQQYLAVKRGATLVREVVTKVDRISSGCFEIHTKSNRSITADKVVLCAGAFLFHNNLLSKHINVDVYPRLIRVARLPMDEDLVKKFYGMPSISLMTTRERDANPCNDKFYMMAPVKYPDGKFYLKVGLHSDLKDGLTEPREVTEWHRNGSKQISRSDYRSTVSCIAQKFLPDLDVNTNDYVFDACSIMETPNQRLYIDRIESNLYIATGCNGYAAKSSDEIGRLIATLALTDKWDCPYPAEDFSCKFTKICSNI